MKIIKLLLGSLLLLGGLSSSAEVHIREIGLQGHVSSSGPGRVRIEISNPASQSGSFVLRLMEANSQTSFFHADYKLQLKGGETRQLELPALLGRGEKLRAEQMNAGGLIVSSDEQNIIFDNSELIAVICNSPAACKSVSDAIRSGVTIQEQNEKESALKIVLMLEAPQTWFAYTPARFVVVAGPVPAPAREAMASYARFGGQIILVGDQAPRDFLAEYRAAGLRKAAIGKGTIRFVDTAAGPEMRAVFAPEKRDLRFPYNLQLNFQMTLSSSALLQWTGTQFVFPRLRWVIGWMVLYTIIIGVVNFVILRRVGKVELGWITVPVIATCFALLFYFISVRGKMTRFTLDEATVCWMDDKSPYGAAEHRLRVASPQVRDVVLQTPTSAVMSASAHDPLFTASDAATIWDDATRKRPSNSIPDIVVDTLQHVPMGMLRLSFRDIEFQTVHSFPGTIRLENGVLKNATGESFTQAVVVDFRSRELYELGALADGAETRPLAKTPQNLRSDFKGLQLFDNNSNHLPPKQAFTLSGFLNSTRFGSNSDESSLTFIGLADKPLMQGDLEGIEADRKSYTLFVVTLRRPE